MGKISNSTKEVKNVNTNNAKKVEIANAKKVENAKDVTSNEVPALEFPKVYASTMIQNTLWDMICYRALGVDKDAKRAKSNTNTLDKQYYGINRATSLLLTITTAQKEKNVYQYVNDWVDNNGVQSCAVCKDLISRNVPRSAVCTYVEVCIISNSMPSIEDFDARFVCLEGTNERSQKLYKALKDDPARFGLSVEDFNTIVSKTAKGQKDDKALKLKLMEEHPELTGAQITDMINKMPKETEVNITQFIEEVQRVTRIKEAYFTSISQVKDYVYFII